MKDDGEAALLRERDQAYHAEVLKYGPLEPGVHRAGTLRELPEIEGTEAAKQAFREKMAAFRKGGAPAYIGPRAGRD